MDLRVGFPEPWRSGLKQQLLRVEAPTGAGEKKSLCPTIGVPKNAQALQAQKRPHTLFCEPDRTSWKAKEPNGILRCRNTTYSQGISVGIGHTKSLSDVSNTPSAPRT
jgi:hypothetical protein